MLATYEPKLVMVNLVDQTGRELALAHAFLDHVLDADNPEVSKMVQKYSNQIQLGVIHFIRLSRNVSRYENGACWNTNNCITTIHCRYWLHVDRSKWRHC